MTEWRICQLRELGDVLGGGTPSRERPEYWNGTIPWLTPGELTGNGDKYVVETLECISELGLGRSGAKLVPIGSLLVTSRASIGFCALAGKPMATNQGFKNLIPGDSVDPSYLFHLGRTLGREMKRRASGTTFLEISGREFGRIRVHLPPLEEQRWIAEILDTIDQTIQATERIIAKHKRVRRGLASDLLEGKSTRATRNWRKHRLIEIVASSVDGPFGSALKTEHYVPSAGVRVVRLANLGDGNWIDGDDAFIEEGYARVLRRHDVRAGDVLVASLGDDNHRPGRACLYPKVFAPGIVKADCFRFRPSRSVDSRFLMEILNSRGASSQIRRLAQGVTRDRVNLSQLRQVILKVPPLEEQRRIGAILDAIDGTIRVHQDQLDKLRQLRSGLAADLLSGRIRTAAA